VKGQINHYLHLFEDCYIAAYDSANRHYSDMSISPEIVLPVFSMTNRSDGDGRVVFGSRVSAYGAVTVIQIKLLLPRRIAFLTPVLDIVLVYTISISYRLR
jgi:hypothetical protein